MRVNGLLQHIRYNADTVEHLFLPLLRRLTQMQRRAGRRVIAFLAAPPAAAMLQLSETTQQR